MIKVSIDKTTGAYAALVSVISGSIVWFNFRPLGVFFFSGLVVFWCRQYANLRLQMTPLVEEKIQDACHRVLQFKKRKPGLFCVLISCFLILLAVIGHVVSGAYIVIALLLLSFVISTKYDIKIVADNEKKPSKVLPSILDQEVEEFLPEINELNASILQQVGEDADVSAVYKSEKSTRERGTGEGNGEDEDDDTCSDFIPQNSITEMDEELSNDSSSDDLLLGNETKSVQDASAVKDDLRFKSSHFNANTSSDSDDSISRGLSFDDVPDKGTTRKRVHLHHSQYEQQPHLQLLQPLDQLKGVGGSLLAEGVRHYLTSALANVSATMSQSQPAPSSSSRSHDRMTVSLANNSSRAIHQADSTDEDGDSDFEMLNPDELNNV